MSNNDRKRLFTDSYTTEIKITLVLLIGFLLSLNFLTAYSLGKARQAQHDEHVLNLELVKENIRADIFANKLKLPDITYLQSTARRSLIDKIELVDSQGNRLMMVGRIEPDRIDDAITVTSPIRSETGEIVYYLFVTSLNREGAKLQRLAYFDSIFRIAGLIAGLILAFFFVKTVLNPYKKIKKEAEELDLPDLELEKTDDIEYVVRKFHQIIRELKMKEAQLESRYNNSEKRADSLSRYNEYILGGISSGVIICDNSGIITRFNLAAGNILNIDYEKSQGSKYSEIFGENHHITKILNDALSKDLTVSRSEFEITTENSDKRWIGLSSSLIVDNQQVNIGAAVLLSDLTKIKKLQEISDFTEKMAALGEMSAGLAHEFRNSVAAIMGFGKLIRKMLPDDHKANNIAEMIISESQTSEEMLRRFLTFARPLKVIPEPVELRKVINDSLQLAKESNQDKSILLKVEGDTPGVEIDADSTILKNAFSNLFINAYQAMDNAGRLSIKISMNDPGEQVVIRISDTGEGIPGDVIPKIFNPFFTTKDKGTGLGLALVKKIITGHYGSIEVESVVGEGTTFIVTLPLKEKSNFENNEKHSVTEQIPVDS